MKSRNPYRKTLDRLIEAKRARKTALETLQLMHEIATARGPFIPTRKAMA